MINDKGLTPNQQRIADSLVIGIVTTKDLCWALELKRDNLKHHLKALFRRFHVHNRAELCLVLKRRGATPRGSGPVRVSRVTVTA